MPLGDSATRSAPAPCRYSATRGLPSRPEKAAAPLARARLYSLLVPVGFHRVCGVTSPRGRWYVRVVSLGCAAAWTLSCRSLCVGWCETCYRTDTGGGLRADHFFGTGYRGASVNMEGVLGRLGRACSMGGTPLDRGHLLFRISPEATQSRTILTYPAAEPLHARRARRLPRPRPRAWTRGAPHILARRTILSIDFMHEKRQ